VKLKFVPALVALLGSSTAVAGWQFEAVKGPAPDPETRRGFVAAGGGDATLRLDCVNGAQLLSLSVGRDLERGMIGSVIAVDERKPRSLLLQVFSDPRRIPLFDIPLRDIRRARHLRVDLQPIAGSPSSYDFDISGARKAFETVVCGAKPKSLFRRLVR
jgi:hypothetical protein